MRDRAIRGGLAGLGAFGGAAWAWIAFALSVPGDFFDAGLGLLLAMLLCAVGGAVAGWRARRVLSRAALATVLALPLLFLAIARDGWWAHGPPPARVTDVE